MTKDIVMVDPVTSDQDEKEPRKPKVDDGKPLDDSASDELSEEDRALKEELELLVLRLTEHTANLHKPALEQLRTQIRSSTSSMTSVPKPLKFLRPHYDTLKKVYEAWPESNANKKALADVLSVLGMTYAGEGVRDSLKYRLVGSDEELGSWGHEYVRHLAAEIGEEYAHRVSLDDPLPTDDLLLLAKQIVPFFLRHNAEADAVDLLLELEAIDVLVPLVDKATVHRVGLYMTSCVPYLPYPDDVAVLRAAHAIYVQCALLPEALVVAMRLDDKALAQQDFDAAKGDGAMRRQLAFMLARNAVAVSTDDETEQQILANAKLSEHFIALARDLGVAEPKTPDDIYKTHLEARSAAGTLDSAKHNLAASLVNAFVNCGFGHDKLLLTKPTASATEAPAAADASAAPAPETPKPAAAAATEDEASQWVYKNKAEGMATATASVGVLSLWDVPAGLAHVDKYLYSSEEHVKAGALLAIGLVTANVRDENDPALALLSEHVALEAPANAAKVAAVTGLGIAYAGTAREDVAELLLPLIGELGAGVAGEVACAAALAAGQVLAGTCDGDATSAILQALMEHPEAHARHRFLALGLALLYSGKQEACEATLETLKAIESPSAASAAVLVEALAYAGTGNVLKVQQFTRACAARFADDKAEAAGADALAFAVLGIALVAMGEDVGAEMAARTYQHLTHYGTPAIKKAVPLAMALQSVSNPQVQVLDTLSKFSHDHDQDVAVNAIFAMGLVGAGTNNARLAQMLRQLASYYHRDPACLFAVRVAQGLVHMGKGTVGLLPYTTGRSILHRVALGGLLSVLVALTDAKSTILGKAHWMLYHLVGAMYPRMLLTLDEELQPKSVSVRVGQAVDTVGQAGRPKTITGFQTHSTPVLMAHNERAELATEEFLTVTPVVEGFVIVKKNPEYMDEDKA